MLYIGTLIATISKTKIITKLSLFIALSFFTQLVFAQISEVIVQNNGEFTIKIETSNNKWVEIDQLGKIKDVQLVGSIEYWNSGKLKSIGSVKFEYWNSGRIKSINDINLDYCNSGRIKSVGNQNIDYWNSGRVKNIDNTNIDYWNSGKLKSLGNKSIEYWNSGKNKAMVRYCSENGVIFRNQVELKF